MDEAFSRWILGTTPANSTLLLALCSCPSSMSTPRKQTSWRSNQRQWIYHEWLLTATTNDGFRTGFSLSFSSDLMFLRCFYQDGSYSTHGVNNTGIRLPNRSHDINACLDEAVRHDLLPFRHFFFILNYLYLSQWSHHPGHCRPESCGFDVAPVGQRWPEGQRMGIINAAQINQ